MSKEKITNPILKSETRMRCCRSSYVTIKCTGHKRHKWFTMFRQGMGIRVCLKKIQLTKR